MESGSLDVNTGSLHLLLRGEPGSIRRSLDDWRNRDVVLSLLVILAGTGLYGAAMGWWRAPLQGLFVAVKFPLIILLMMAGNALLNAMLAPLLGLNVTFRQSIILVLMSFTVASAVLGAFSPLAGFVVWNAPPMTPGMSSAHGPYNFIQLTHVTVIAFAGIVGNARLLQLLQQLAGRKMTAGRVLVAWLAGNLFLGSQLSWILRPFIGSPDLPVQFLRPTAFQGNFYETVLRALVRVFSFD
jgi:hypothetical protein